MTIQTLNILLVEECADDRRLMRERVNSVAGVPVQVSEASNALEALKMMAEAIFDCAVVNFHLPGHDGLWLMNTLRDHCIDLPLVMLTGEGDEPALAAMEHGAQEYLPKTEIPRADLLQLVLSAIERKQEEFRLEIERMQDAVTGVYTREVFWERLPEALARAEQMQRAAMLVYLDLKGFEEIQDKLGGDMANEVLRECARRVTSILRACDSMARISDDHFVVLLEDLDRNDRDTYYSLAEKILRTIRDHPVQVDSSSVMLGINTGVAVFPDTASTREQLFDAARRAMLETTRTARDGITFADGAGSSAFTIYQPEKQTH